MNGDTTTLDTYNDIEGTILEYFSDYWSFTPIQYPNLLFDPTPYDSWCQIFIVPIDKKRLCMTGNESTGLLTKGTVVINLFVRTNVGTGLIKSYVKNAVSLFNYTSLTTDTSDVIQFEVSKLGPGNSDGLWYKETVKTDFNVVV